MASGICKSNIHISIWKFSNLQIISVVILDHFFQGEAQGASRALPLPVLSNSAVNFALSSQAFLHREVAPHPKMHKTRAAPCWWCWYNHRWNQVKESQGEATALQLEWRSELSSNRKALETDIGKWGGHVKMVADHGYRDRWLHDRFLLVLYSGLQSGSQPGSLSKLKQNNYISQVLTHTTPPSGSMLHHPISLEDSEPALLIVT